jgi:hypothetical protein
VYKVPHDPNPLAKDCLVFKNLKSLLFEDVPDPPIAAASPAAAPAAAVSPFTPTTGAPVFRAPPPAIDPAVHAEIDRGIQTKLLEAVSAANATLYNELDDFLDTMADAIPDEGMRWRKALEFQAKKGHTPQLILLDVDKCIGALEEHGRLFSKNVEQQLKDRVGSRVQSVETLTNQIAAKQRELEALQNEIRALEDRRNTDQAAISTEQAKVERVQARFSVVFPIIMNEVKTQRAKLESFVK